jgi:hypothetical protein
MNIKNIPIHKTNYSTSKSNKKGVVMHWMAGRIAGATARFQQPNQLASAHYGIANNEVVRWVKDEEIAYHGGVSKANIDYIGIEHEGGWLLSDNTRQKPTRETHDTSAHLLANLSSKYGWGRLEYKKNVWKHSDFKATQCCGSLDIDYIINKANELINQSNNQNNTKLMTRENFVSIARKYNRGDFESDTSKPNHINIDHYYNLYLQNPNNFESIIDSLFQNIADLKTKQGIKTFNAEKLRWE